MGFKERIINILGGEVKNSSRTRSSDFLRNGNRDKLYSDWSEVKIDDSDMYKGYTYAAIQKRGNKVASVARYSLVTTANQRTTDAYAERDVEIVHPYLNLIKNSKNFTEKQFWKNISVYLDLAGRYYLGVVRTEFKNIDPKKPTFLTDARKFVLLNPYEIKRVKNKDGEIAGYVETKPDGRERIWAPYQIIEMTELNPFNGDAVWAMTDAAKDAIFTMEQSSDYTRQSMQGNLNAPGIISTDVILEDEEFANFRSRILASAKGEPLFGNGSGAINWQSMQTDLDRAALLDINEINRNVLFAVSGTSKTVLGIEESGTTRETARVQTDSFVSDAIEPRIEDIIGFLNLDYRKNYSSDFEKTGYEIELQDVLSKDYDSEIKAVQLRTEQMTLVEQLIANGYTRESAISYVYGEVGLEGLVEDDTKQNDNPFGSEGGEDEGPEEPEGPDAPEEPKAEEDEEVAVTPVNLDAGSVTDKDIENASSELFHLDVHKDLEIEENEAEVCTCDHEEDIFYNALDDDGKTKVKEELNSFLDEVKEVQNSILEACIDNVNANAFQESDLIDKAKKSSFISILKNSLKKYWKVLFPLYGNNLIAKRNDEFSKDVSLDFTESIEESIDNNANEVANSHVNAIIKDVIRATNRTYTNAFEKKAASLLLESFKLNPEKWVKYFSKKLQKEVEKAKQSAIENNPDKEISGEDVFNSMENKPSELSALRAIRNTKVLDENKKLYERANKLSLSGVERQGIIKTIRSEFRNLSKTRANTIAKNETSRAFTQSQYEADRHFLNSIGKLNQAYKKLYSRTGNPCPVCQKLIDKGPIPFEQNFLNKGDSIEFEEDGKVKNFVANYEDISAGVVHCNCQCQYELVFIENELDKTENELELNGGDGSGNFGHSGRPGKVGGSGKGDSSDSGSNEKAEEKETKAKEEKKEESKPNPNGREVFKMLHEITNWHKDSKSDDQLDKVTPYFGDFAATEKIQNYLMGGDDKALNPYTWASDAVRAFQAKMAETTFPEDVTLYRGMMIRNDRLERAEKNGFYYSGFQSTSTLGSGATAILDEYRKAGRFDMEFYTPVLLKITAKKGQHFASSYHDGEHEIVLPNGIQFKVNKKSTNSSGAVIFEVEYGE